MIHFDLLGWQSSRDHNSILGWESDGKDKYKDSEDLEFLQQKEIECREELIARVSTSLEKISQNLSMIDYHEYD